LRAGWTVADIRHALDHTPSGQPWPYAWRSTRELRNPAGWLLHRMHAWTDSHGPLPDPHQARAVLTATERAHQRRRREDAERDSAKAAAPATVVRVASELRAQLRAASWTARSRPGRIDT
jgi:hypothetical protein